MLKKTIWYILLLISIIVTLIFISGFVKSLAITTTSKKATEVTPPPSKIQELDPNYYNILVLGDSLSKGTGDEKGKGFAGYFSDSWKSKSTKEIKLTNIAIIGDVSAGLLKVVESAETQSYIKTSKIIFISIGGNEINKFKEKDLTLAVTDVKDAQDKYLNNLKEIMKLIRTNNSSCMVIFLGLYNPNGEEVTADKVTFLTDWNYRTEQFISTDTNSIFIPTYDLFKYNLDNYLYKDKFHPNSAGYEAISNRMLEALKNYK
ncbi:MAG: acyl-CoA thioesterase [Clostridiaceae bacterium]|nr:acyl-CoA thioesterase [Clostridiaceae bacterium]